jgi:hypothetical protein
MTEQIHCLLYLNGTMVASKSISGSISADTSLLTIGRDPTTVGPIGSKYFKGKIDEVRVFNVALTDSHLQRMVYQEIQIHKLGVIVPKDIATAPAALFSNLLRYYRMDTYKDDIIDDHDHNRYCWCKIIIIKIFTSNRHLCLFNRKSWDFAAAVNSPIKEIRGVDIMENAWSIESAT